VVCGVVVSPSGTGVPLTVRKAAPASVGAVVVMIADPNHGT
jgi:hypothetical protein